MEQEQSGQTVAQHHSARDFWRACVHEAGHALLVVLADPHAFLCATVEPVEDALGSVDHGPLGKREMARVSCAGILAEEQELNRSDFGGEAGDYVGFLLAVTLILSEEHDGLAQHARSNLFAMLGAFEEGEDAVRRTVCFGALCREICNETRQVLKKERAALCAIARALEEKRTLKAEEVLVLWEENKT